MQFFLHDFARNTVEFAASWLERKASFKLVSQFDAQARRLRWENLPLLHPERVAHYFAMQRAKCRWNFQNQGVRRREAKVNILHQRCASPPGMCGNLTAPRFELPCNFEAQTKPAREGGIWLPHIKTVHLNEPTPLALAGQTFTSRDWDSRVCPQFSIRVCILIRQRFFEKKQVISF